jgi:hypothetical protein
MFGSLHSGGTIAMQPHTFIDSNIYAIFFTSIQLRTSKTTAAFYHTSLLAPISQLFCLPETCRTHRQGRHSLATQTETQPQQLSNKSKRIISKFFAAFVRGWLRAPQFVWPSPVEEYGWI